MPSPRADAALPPSGPVDRPLVVTGDDALLDDLLRLAAAAGVDVEVAHDAVAARRSWSRSGLVLAGPDAVDDAIRLGLPRRSGVVLVGVNTGAPPLWEQAVALGAEHVVFLPDAQSWLTERLADAVESERTARLVSVMGGRGGAGATTLAAALAVTAARERRSSMLVDGDPMGGGIDLVLGGEDCTGLRWPSLAGTRGRVGAGSLREALPSVDGLTVLSWDRGDRFDVAPEAMAAVLGAARRGCDLVVVDLPRRLDSAGEVALSRSDVTLLLVPAEVRATAAATRVAAAAGLVAGDLRVVVRGPAPSGLPAAVVAEALGLPLAGTMDPEPGIAAALERGEPPGRRPRAPLARFCRDFLSALLPLPA